ncbi:MAG TPA: phosphoglycerate kinase [Candidatus Paceibacterota bacterium]
METLKDSDFQGKRVLLRCDFNVPVENGVIQDDFRITSSIPTIQYITGKGGKCIVLAHFGRPEGKIQEEFSLRPVVKRLEELLGKKVALIKEPIGQGAKERLEQLAQGEVALLENIRFYPGEEENDEHFAELLAKLGDIYVNDAFGACHRAHASIVGVPKFLPSAMGLLLEKEIQALDKVRTNPEKPLVVLVGGAKVNNKASFLKAISKSADAILLGDLLTIEVKEKGRQGIDVSSKTELVYATDGVDGTFDLGPETIQKFTEKITSAKTIFWAGPLGMVEEEKYEKGSLAIADAILQSGAYAVAGGGDLAAFLGKHHLREKFAHVSTGGGAMLAFLAGEKLPGLKALDQ